MHSFSCALCIGSSENFPSLEKFIADGEVRKNMNVGSILSDK